ncbi:MAG: hypothetical protein ACTS7I_01515 [Candidatus Hodgkinia cicadicola]
MSVEGNDGGLTTEERTYRWLAIRCEQAKRFERLGRRTAEVGRRFALRQIVRCERARATVGRS